MALRISTNWIISREADLLFLILSSFGAYFLLALMLASTAPVVIWFLWAALLDTPHYFGTYSRAYLDPATRLEHRGRFRVGHALLGLGPAVVLLCWLLHSAGVERYRQPLLLFAFVFNLWAFWHLVRQHYGIMALYKRKSADSASADRVVDQFFLYGGLISSLVLLAMRHPEARAGLGLAPTPPSYALLLERGMSASGDLLITLIAWGVIFGSALLFVGRQAHLAVRGREINGPKVLLLVAVVSSYVCVSAFEPGHRLPLLLWAGVITIGHNFQYFAFVYFQHRRRYHGCAVPNGRPAEPSWANRVSTSPARFVLLAVLLGGSLRLFGAALGIFPDLPSLIDSARVVLFGEVALQDLLLTCMLGIAMHHYWLDQFLWRPSRDGALRADLGVSA